ncbi:MAG: hypothetical protein ABI461_17610, partial [Polyangiaceae bacterium]
MGCAGTRPKKSVELGENVALTTALATGIVEAAAEGAALSIALAVVGAAGSDVEVLGTFLQAPSS